MFISTFSEIASMESKNNRKYKRHYEFKKGK